MSTTLPLPLAQAPAPPEAAPAPVAAEPEGPVGGDEPTFTSRADERSAAAEEERRDRAADETPVALKAGVALAVVGGVALGGGAVTSVLANKTADELAALSSSSISNTSTGFPSGDWDCRVPGQECAADLDKRLKTYNGLTGGLLIGGGVLAGAGVALIVVGVMQKKKAAQAMVVPTFGPDGVGAAASFKF